MWGEQQPREPIIVQGTIVPQQQQQAPQQQYVQPYEKQQPDYNLESSYNSNNNNGTQKGEKQPARYNDVGFAIFFVIHLLAAIGFMFAAPYIAVEDDNNNNNNDDISYAGIITHVSICSVAGVTLSTLLLGFMMQFAKQLIKMALIFSVAMSGVMAVLGILSGEMMMGLLGLAFFAAGICYSYMVWSTIPFAAANMNTGLTAVKSNLGLAFVGYVFLFAAFFWTVSWSMAVNVAVSAYGEGLLAIYLLSYFWTHQVIQNTVRVTTAGVVGTWWFNPVEASSCCSPAIYDSFSRATTYSFGSICFGSLIVAIVQTLRQLNHYARQQNDCQMLVCCIDCFLGCIEDILEYLNKWAYVYVGLYGYGYIEAGKNVMTLFQQKGWTVIITNDLVENVLFMMSLVTGLIIGVFGMIVAGVDQNLLADIAGDDVKLVGFGLGFIVGFVFSSILMGLVGSSVNTVIVCFAEAPNEFQNNHPQLATEMREAWREAYPEQYNGM